jgi:DNA polymerase-3 subunit beta
MNLKQAIITAASATQPRNAPVLAMVAIKAENGKIQFTGTDTQVGITTTADYDAGEFACCVDAKRLVAAINVVDQPKFKMTDSHLLITQGRMRFQFPMLHFDMHPGLPEMPSDGVEISSDAVKMMADVRYAAGKNDVRFYLNGVYLYADNGTLSAVASDGHRLSMQHRPHSGGDFKIILPNNAIAHIIKHQPDRLIVGRMMRCLNDDFEMVCTAIDSKYPDFKKVLQDSDDSITVNRQEFLTTLHALNALRDVAPELSVYMSWKDGVLDVISNATADSSEIANQIPATFTSSNEITLNLGYLIDIVDAVGGDDITFSFLNSSSPLACRREHALDLVMSMRR